MLLNRVILLGWLPRLIECLKDKDVDAPVEDRADGLLPVFGLVLDGSLVAVLEGLALGGPSGLANPELKILVALDGLDAVESLHNVVVEGLGSVGHLLALPVGEGVGETDGSVRGCFREALTGQCRWEELT